MAARSRPELISAALLYSGGIGVFFLFHRNPTMMFVLFPFVVVVSWLPLVLLQGRRRIPTGKAVEALIRAAEVLGLDDHDPENVGGTVNGFVVAIAIRQAMDGDTTRIQLRRGLGALSARSSRSDSSPGLFVGDPALIGVRIAGPAAEVFAALDPAARRGLAQLVLDQGGSIDDGTMEVRLGGTANPPEVLVGTVRKAVELALAIRSALSLPRDEALTARATEDPVVEMRLACLLGVAGQDPVIARKAMSDPEAVVRAAAALALGGATVEAARGDPDVEPALLKLLDSGVAALGEFAAHALGELASPHAMQALARKGGAGTAGAARLRERHPFAGEAQLSLARGREGDAGAVSIALPTGAVSLAKGRSQV